MRHQAYLRGRRKGSGLTELVNKLKQRASPYLIDILGEHIPEEKPIKVKVKRKQVIKMKKKKAPSCKSKSTKELHRILGSGFLTELRDTDLFANGTIKEKQLPPSSAMDYIP